MSESDKPTLEYVRSILRYVPDTGEIVNIVARNPKSPAGRIARDLNSNGYVRVQINKRRYLGHVFAWFYMTGEWPDRQIDHINGVRDDNRWENLRLATNKQNHENVKLRSDNTSGHRGVYFSKKDNKWIAQVTHKMITYHVGIFAELNDAVTAVKAARDRLFTHHKTEYSS